jgi:hypothetical protein
MPAGALMTVPLPVPASDTVTGTSGTVVGGTSDTVGGGAHGSVRDALALAFAV